MECDDLLHAMLHEVDDGIDLARASIVSRAWRHACAHIARERLEAHRRVIGLAPSPRLVRATSALLLDLWRVQVITCLLYTSPSPRD